MKKKVLFHFTSTATPPDMTVPLHYGNFTVSTRQNAEEVFSCSDLLYGAGDLRGVVDAGTAARKEIA